MGIKLSRSDALAYAIASVRMEGLRITPAGLAILEKCAAGEITIERAKEIILARYRKSSSAPDASSK